MNKSLVLKVIKLTLIRGGGAVAGFLLTFFVSIFLPLEDAGLSFLFISSTLFLGGVFAIGSPNFILRKVGADFDTNWGDINNSHSILLRAIVLVSLPFCVICFVVPNVIANKVLGVSDFESLVPLLGLAALTHALILFFSNSLLGAGASARGSLTQNGISQFLFVIVFFLSYRYVGSINAQLTASIYLATLAIALFLGIWIWYVKMPGKFCVNGKLNSHSKKSLFTFWIALLMSQCVQFAGQFAVAKYLSASDIALFTLAFRVALITSFILIAVNLVVAPQFAKAYKRKDINEINRVSLQSSRIMLAIASPLVIALFVFSEEVLHLFGEDYRDASHLLKIFIVAQFINVFTGSVGYILNMTHNEKDMRNVVMISGVFSVLTAFGFTAVWGLSGAAWATGLSVMLQNMLAVYYVKLRLGFNTLNVFRQVV